MRPYLLLFVLFVGVCIIAPGAIADTVYLEAAFNDKTVGQPIGTGGAAVGEPISISEYVTTTVADTPMPTVSLQIQDNSTTAAGAVCFEFIDDAELTTGTVVVAADLWFAELTPGYEFSLLVREHGSATKVFTDLDFTENGDVWCTDQEGPLGVVGTYATGQTFRVIIDYNMDAGTYDLYLNGLRVLDDEPHGVTGRGVGRVYFGCMSDSDLVGAFNVDAVTVTDYYQATNTQMTTWGLIKSSFH